ncbi:hypothetical protein VTI28DRAFT_5958 [Corynascus sepedonium]
MAQDNRVWKLIDLKSASGDDFKERPVERRFADYPKRLDTPASDIRASSTTCSSTPGLIDTEGTPRNLRLLDKWRRYEPKAKEPATMQLDRKSVDTHISTKGRYTGIKRLSDMVATYSKLLSGTQITNPGAQYTRSAIKR